MTDRNERMNQRGARAEASVSSMKKRLMKVDFAMIETMLYLDAYPHCHAALDYYHKLGAERENLVAALSAAGVPVTARDVAHCGTWNWTDGPWPWQHAAN